MIRESFEISLAAVSLERLEQLTWAAAEAEWENDTIRMDLMQIANDCRSRLQRISKGDIQAQ